MIILDIFRHLERVLVLVPDVALSAPWPAIQAKEMTVRAMHPGRIITPPGQGKEMAGATRYHVRKGLCAMGLSAEPAGVERAEMYTWTQGE